MAPTRTLPPAEDADELAMDRAAIRFSVDLEPDDYRRLCEERLRRQLDGQSRTSSSLTAIIREAIRKHLPGSA